MDFNKIYQECQCAGSGCGGGTISSFAPENAVGVVDIKNTDKEELNENKLKEWEGTSNFSKEKEMLKQSFFHKKDFWEQEPDLANCVSKIILGFNAFSRDDDPFDNII